MSTLVVELYDALRKAGVDDVAAIAAAQAVMGAPRAEDQITRAALRAEIAELKAELIKWNVGAIVALTAIFAAIVRLT